MNSFTVTKNDEGLSLYKFSGRILANAPGSFIYKSLRNKDIRLNGKKALGNEILKEGDEVLFRFPDVQFESLSGTDRVPVKEHDINKYCTVVYEDDDIIVCDKKAGVLSQKAKAADYSLNEALLSYVNHTGGAFTPSVCNRLDTNTTGLVAFAKTYRGARELNDAFKERSTEKYYLAAVFGDVKEGGILKGELSKDHKENRVSIKEGGGETVLTAYEPLMHNTYRGIPVTLLKVRLYTGKTHQIRAHLAASGMPVAGDPKYGDTELNKRAGLSKQMLHAFKLLLPGREPFYAKAPEKFTELFPEYNPGYSH